MVAVLGLAGSALGVVAGSVQAGFGRQIPDWTGAKAAPLALGLLTIGLSALAGLAAVRQRDAGLSVWGRTACALGLIGPGLLCLSTVGRLWYPSAVLLVVAGVMTIDSWRATARAFADDWFRVLLTALGGFEILMAAGASPGLMTVGAVGGITLIVAAWLSTASREVPAWLVVIGTVPFAVLAWHAVVPVLLAVVATVVAIPVILDRFPRPAPAGDAARVTASTSDQWVNKGGEGGGAREAIRSAGDWVKFLLGFAVLLSVLLGTSALDASGRFGLAILAVVLLTGIVVERLLFGVGPREALRLLGFSRPGGRALLAATIVGALVQLVYPLAAWLTGTTVALRPDWPWLLIGIFAFHGLAEELVWRGYAYRRLRSGRSFRAAVLWTMPLVAVAHVPIVVTSGPLVGGAALIVAAVTSVPLAYLFDAGRSTIWAPAVVHTAIDSFKLVIIPAAAVTTFSLLLAAVSIVVPLLVLAVPRAALQSVRIRQRA